MIKINPIASSSKGNAYQITDGRAPLLLEAGIPIKALKKALNFGLSNIQGCLVTHAHLDHARALDGVMIAGINCYMSKGTSDALGLSGHRLKTVKSMQQFKIGSWDILPFESVHDAPEPLNFLLQSGNEKLLFITDSAYCKYRFKGITHLMIECNYCVDILQENIKKGVISTQQKNRLLFSHFSLENVLKFLKVNDLSKLKEVYLLHLSSRNSDAVRMKEEVQRVTGKPTYIAKE